MDLRYKIQANNKNKDLDVKELIRGFESYGQKGEIVNVTFRC